MKRILVTGASGFIGYEVARQLAARGFRPRLMIRRPLRADVLSSLDAEMVMGDLEVPATLDRAVDGVDTVFHLAARAVFEDYARLRPTIVDGSRGLMEAARRAGVQSFVYASSLLVYGDQDSEIDESRSAVPQLGYGRAKLEAEQVLSQVAESAGIRLAIIRLPHVYGARDLLFEQIRRGRLVFPGGGENQFAHLHVEDAARIMIAAAEQRWEGVRAVADDLSTTWNEFFEVVRQFYPRFRATRIPKWLGLMGTGLIHLLGRISSTPSLYTPGAVTGWNLNIPVKPGLLWNDLGLQPCYRSIHRGIPAVLDDCIQFRWLHPVRDNLGA